MQVVIYHRNCQDGLFSALNFWNVYGDNQTVYIPASYGFLNNDDHETTLNKLLYKQNLPDRKLVDLILVDFCFSVEFFLYCKDVFRSVLILDHHESSKLNFLNHFKHFNTIEHGWIEFQPFNNTRIIFSENESGAKLSYMYLNPNKEIPYYIELVNDRDLWLHKYPETEQFFFGCELLAIITNPNFHAISQLVSSGLDSVLFLGKSYKSYLNVKIEKIAKSNAKPIPVVIDNNTYKGMIVNSYLDISSDLGNYLIHKYKVDVAFIYNINGKNDVQFSVRSITNLDSSVISKKFGGGGHRNSSGFYVKFDDLQKFLTEGVRV